MKEKLFLNGLSRKSKSDDMRRLRRYFLQRASMEIIDATDANRRRKDEVMKNVQIPYELFVSLLRYHLMEEDDCLNEIRQGLEQKLDSMVRHELYAKYKTALTQEDREKARQEYLDKRGVPDSFRW